MIFTMEDVAKIADGRLSQTSRKRYAHHEPFVDSCGAVWKVVSNTGREVYGIGRIYNVQPSVNSRGWWWIPQTRGAYPAEHFEAHPNERAHPLEIMITKIEPEKSVWTLHFVRLVRE